MPLSFGERLILLPNMDKNGILWSIGDVAEWSNAPVSKTGIPQGIGGSNPPVSARKNLLRFLPLFGPIV